MTAYLLAAGALIALALLMRTRRPAPRIQQDSPREMDRKRRALREAVNPTVRAPWHRRLFRQM